MQQMYPHFLSNDQWRHLLSLKWVSICSVHVTPSTIWPNIKYGLKWRWNHELQKPLRLQRTFWLFQLPQGCQKTAFFANLNTRYKAKNNITASPYKRYTRWNWILVRSPIGGAHFHPNFKKSFPPMIHDTHGSFYDVIIGSKLEVKPRMINK